MDQPQNCDVCGTLSTHRCGNCQAVYYCSEAHQKSGWKTHKKNCRPYKVRQDPELGRRLVATRTIPAGTVVLKEQPLVWGPAHDTPSVCLGCLKVVNEHEARPCSKCGWPVCSEQCENNPSHKPECYYTTKVKGKVIISNFRTTGHHILYYGILALRCLYQSRFAPKTWAKINDLESHCDSPIRSTDYEEDFQLTCNAICNFLQLPNEFTNQEIRRACGIILGWASDVKPVGSRWIKADSFMNGAPLPPPMWKIYNWSGRILYFGVAGYSDGASHLCCIVNVASTVNRGSASIDDQVNSFAIPMAEPNPTALYHQTSIFEHSCRANCYKLIAPNGDIKIVSGVHVEKGQPLSICYTQPLFTTVQRQRYLLDTKLFLCKCERCLNTTEFGTNFSSLKCQKQNCPGVLLPESFVLQASPWVCNACKTEIAAKSAIAIFDQAEKDLDEIKGSSVAACKEFLTQYETIFPDSHGFLINAKMRIAFKIDLETEGGMEYLSESDLMLMRDYCQQVKHTFEILAPAQKKMYCNILSQLQVAMKEISRRKEAAGELSHIDSLLDLRERQALLEEVVKYNKLDPDFVHLFEKK